MSSALPWNPKRFPENLADEALCGRMVAEDGVDPDLWHPKRRMASLIRPAALICSVCPVRVECLSYALEYPGRISGVWGGVYFQATAGPGPRHL